MVDDGSTDDTARVVENFKFRISNFEFVRQNHEGTGMARNTGVKAAKGKILVFADSDVVFFKDTLFELAKSFKDRKVKAVVGVYDKKPTNPSFFTYFKALRDYSYIMLERDSKHPMGGFGGWISAIRKTVFQDLGGFDESYRGAGMEDYEFAWRLIKKTKIIFNPKVKIRHHFGSFWNTLKNFYKRSYLWTRLYLKHKKFFSSATNPREAFIAGLANLSTGLLFLSWLARSTELFIVFLIVFVIRVYLGRVFLLFAAEKKGILFALATLPISHALYLAVYLGVARAVFYRYVLMRR